MITDTQLTKAFKITGFSILTLYIIEIVACVILKANGIIEMPWRGVICLFIVSLPIGLTIYSSIYQYFAKRNKNERMFFD